MIVKQTPLWNDFTGLVERFYFLDWYTPPTKLPNIPETFFDNLLLKKIIKYATHLAQADLENRGVFLIAVL